MADLMVIDQPRDRVVPNIGSTVELLIRTDDGTERPVKVLVISELHGDTIIHRVNADVALTIPFAALRAELDRNVALLLSGVAEVSDAAVPEALAQLEGELPDWVEGIALGRVRSYRLAIPVKNQHDSA